MATLGFDSDSDSYGYDLTASDEENLVALIDNISPPTPSQQARARRSSSPPRPPPFYQPREPAPPFEYASSNSSFDNDLQTDIAINEAIEDITENDLSFDISELEPDTTLCQHESGSESEASIVIDLHFGQPVKDDPPVRKRRPAPSVASDDASLASFVAQTKPRSTPRRLAAHPTVRYPDLSRALHNVQSEGTNSPRSGDTSDASKPHSRRKTPAEDGRAPLLRFRTFPKKPFSVSDLTSGSWCELQYFYTLTRLPGGKKTRTAAMKGGSKVHEKLEREVFEKVTIDITKKVDGFGIKIWNIIEGLRTLRDQGMTRELEIWGTVEGEIVNGVIDELSYENPDPGLEDDVISTRGSQNSQSSSQQQLALGHKVVFIKDAKTRMSKTPPTQAAVRVVLIQLSLYHRFLSQMASGKVDYISIFQRYGLDPDDPFSDGFMAQMASLHDEILSDAGSEASETTERTGTTDTSVDFVSAPSSPSEIWPDMAARRDPDDHVRFMKYRTLRSLLPLLTFELAMTFPRGAETVGQIVSVDYLYRARSDEENYYQGKGDEEQPAAGALICTQNWYVEPEKLNDYLKKDMEWWRGERAPNGVLLEEGFKCRFCEFVKECDWQKKLEQESLRKSRLESADEKAKGRQKRIASIQW